MMRSAVIIRFAAMRRELRPTLIAPGILAVSLGCMIFTADTARADVTPLGDEIQVNTYTLNSQTHPSVAMAANGEFVVVWSSVGSNGLDDDSSSVQGQRFTSDGTPIDGEFTVNSFTTGDQSYPMVVTQPAGGFVVVWQSDGSSGSDNNAYSIQGQRFDSEGTAQGPELQINSYTTNYQTYPRVAVNPTTGDFVVVWQSTGSADTDSSSHSIQARRFASNGAALSADFQVNSYTTNGQIYPVVARKPDGSFVVLWHSQGSAETDNSVSSVQLQQFAPDGTRLGGEIQVNTFTTGWQSRPSVAVGLGGEFVVVWESYVGPSVYFAIRGRRFASNGIPQGTEFQLTTLDYQRSPSVTARSGGDFVVVWHSWGSDGTDNSGYSVQGRRLASDGTPLGIQFQVNSFTIEYQRFQRVAAGTTGDFVVTWQSVGSSGNDTYRHSIQAQRFRGPTTTSTTTTSTTTTSTTTTTVPECGNGAIDPGEECDDGDTDFTTGEYCAEDCTAVPCGKPTNGPTPNPTTTDALFALGSAVGPRTCDLRVCDVNDSGTLSTTDALIILKKAVGQSIELTCPTE